MVYGPKPEARIQGGGPWSPSQLCWLLNKTIPGRQIRESKSFNQMGGLDASTQ